MVVVPSRMGRMNKRSLLARLQQMGVASRADLAKSLGLSQPTVGKIADELLEHGILEEVGHQEAEKIDNEHGGESARLGRPGIMLQLNRTKARFLGIQLGVSETCLALLKVGADVEDQWAARIRTPDSAAEWIHLLREATRQLPQSEFWGVLLSVPGIVDENAGRILFSPNLHWTEQADLASTLQQIWKAPVLLMQEERALALGHQTVEAGTDDFILVDFAEGVGGAVVIGGKLFANPLPINGEIGHTPVLGNKRPCGCGAVGCVETLVSTRGLLQSFAESGAPKPHTWAALAQHIHKNGLSPWMIQALDSMAVVIAGALNVLGLRRVVLTGSLGELPKSVTDYLSNAVEQGAMWARFGRVECVIAPRRRTAGLVAAGLDRIVLPMTGGKNG